jgi:hypothetical protein
MVGKGFAVAALIGGSVLVSALGLTTRDAAAQSAKDRIIVPGKRAGAITHRTSKARLIRIYGRANVRDYAFPLGEGETAPGAIVYKGTRDEIQIRWKVRNRTVGSVQVFHRASTWRTRRGIRLGTSIQRVQALNGRVFQIYGLGWDYSGRLASWNGGRLPKSLIVAFGERRKTPLAVERKVMGDKKFPSNHPSFIAKRMAVRMMIVELR